VDDLFPLLMVLIFVLGPIIEGLKRKNKRPPPPPPQRRVPPPAAPQRRSRTEELSTRPRTEENASTMVPDDLWEILTGQKRMPGPTAPPAPAPQAERRPSWDIGYDAELEEDEELEEERVTLEDVNVETRRARVEAQSLETISRHPEPVIVSLEENIPSTAQRHADFHHRISVAPPVVEVAPRRKPLFDRNNRSEMQRAFLLQEVFGKPKSLE
jgi:hypothetical protein